MSAPPPYEVTWDPRKAEANITKHGVTFAQAATVLLDPCTRPSSTPHTARTRSAGLHWALPVRASCWPSHMYHQPEGSAQAKVRIISAREATRRERQQYEDGPR